MPRRRIPLSKAKLSGAYDLNKRRYQNRAEVHSPPLGPAPEWMPARQAEIWDELRHALPWLREADAAIVEIAVLLTARMREGAAGAPTLNLLRLTLGQLGATPVSAVPAATPEPDDAADVWFQ